MCHENVIKETGTVSSEIQMHIKGEREIGSTQEEMVIKRERGGEIEGSLKGGSVKRCRCNLAISVTVERGC